MKKLNRREGLTLIELLIAMVIIVFAFAIIVTAPGYMVRLSEKAQIVTDIFDLALSWAEKAIFEDSIPDTSDTQYSTSTTVNHITYWIEFEPISSPTHIYANTKLSVYPVNRSHEKVELQIYVDW